MGKISTGCDIAFVINGNMEDAIRMGTTLSSGQTSYQAIAEALMNQQEIRLGLRDRLKLESSTREVTKDEIEGSGIVHNSTVQNLAKKYPSLDWSNVDQSTKLLATNWFRYYGSDVSDCIVQQAGQGGVTSKIIVIDPSDLAQVSRLNSYLTLQAKLRQYNDETSTVVENSDVKSIVSQLPAIATVMKAQVEEFEKLHAKEQDGTIKKSEEKKLKNLAMRLSAYEHFKQYTPDTAITLLQDFMENSSKYRGLSYVKDGNAYSIASELDNVLKELEGKNVKEATYQDILANEIVSNSKYSPAKNLSYISKSDFTSALRVKLADLQTKRNAMEDKNSEAYKSNQELAKAIEHFLKLENKTPQRWNEIINILIDQTDDEFSYSFHSMDKGVIYLRNVPRTLEERYEGFTYKTVNMLKPDALGSYMGFNIYVAPDGTYYYSRHILTTKSYGRKYKSRDECIQAINQSIQNNPISQQNLIEFKTRGDRDVVFVPNKFIPGQVIKSLNLRFNKKQPLNVVEQELIYNTGTNNSNNLNRFYNYIMSIVDTKTPEYSKKQLQQVIDTAEKASCFIYALNEEEGTDRVKISSDTFNRLLNRIKDAKYEYFLVESVGNRITGVEKHGFIAYTSNTAKGIQKKGVYRTLITPIQAAEINNNLIQTDEKAIRPLPSVRLLNDLAKKIQDKLGVTVHVESQSSLESLFEGWKQEMPSDVHGFIRNGEIYINASNATDEDLFHEYTHIMLGVLKAKNYENYQELVSMVANSESAKYIKKSMKKRYQDLAEQDLNEEVFAEMFSRYMSGRDLGAFLNGTLKNAKKAVDQKMGSIFGSQRITGEFYNADLNNVFSQFGYDLGQIMNEGNGLEISSGKVFRQASVWIEEQIKKYRDTQGGLGIYENCD